MDAVRDGLQARFFAGHDPRLLPAFRAATVGIAGAGGLGSNAAMLLARAGVGRLVLADHDVVEASNLNRQFFFLDQIGQPKVEALATNLRRLNPFSVYEPRRIRLTADNLAAVFGEAAVLVEALDGVEGKIDIAGAWSAAYPERPLILGNGLGGIGGNNAVRTARLFGRVFACGDGLSDVADAPPLAPKVALVAALQANLALELLAGGDSAAAYAG